MLIDRAANATEKRLVTAVLAALVALSLAGCAGRDGMSTGSVSRDSGRAVETMSAPELAATADALGRAYTRDPRDVNVAMRDA